MTPVRPAAPSPRLALALLSLSAALPAGAVARAEPGTRLDDVQLRSVAGGTERLLSTTARANVFVFFRTGQERSADTLRQLAACERELVGKPVHWAAVVSGSEAVADVQAAIAESGIRMPVLVDEGDVLLDRLAIRMHPMVGIADQKLVLVALEPYRQIGYCDLVKARIRVLLGEMDRAELERVLEPPRSPLPGADPMKKAMRDVNMARRLVKLGKYAEARRFAERALGVAPVAQAFAVIGTAWAREGRCAEAARAYEQALKLDPWDPEASAGKGKCR
jgi:tetratricopeptide (TPR) repeat protein